MSTGKRLAKRSILGTRVTVPGADGRYRAGAIQAARTCDASGKSIYSVRLEESGRAFEFAAADIVGSGFAGVSDVQLLEGQRVFVTHNNREVTGRVVRHDFGSQDVLLTVGGSGAEVGAAATTIMAVGGLCNGRQTCRVGLLFFAFSCLAGMRGEEGGRGEMGRGREAYFRGRHFGMCEGGEKGKRGGGSLAASLVCECAC